MLVPTLTPLRLVAACALALVVVAPAYSSPDAVVLDYGDNGRVDAEHSLADLRGALAIWQDNPQYGAFADEVTRAMDRHLLGVAAASSDVPPADAPPRASAPPPATPPTAQTPTPVDRVVEGTVGDLDGDLISSDTALDALPTPPVATASPGGPLPLLVLAAAALLLLVAGMGSAALRRIRP